jgi:hypothetical protein
MLVVKPTLPENTFTILLLSQLHSHALFCYSIVQLLLFFLFTILLSTNSTIVTLLLKIKDSFHTFFGEV